VGITKGLGVGDSNIVRVSRRLAEHGRGGGGFAPSFVGLAEGAAEEGRVAVVVAGWGAAGAGVGGGGRSVGPCRGLDWCVGWTWGDASAVGLGDGGI
jgi:hypothetical protein